MACFLNKKDVLRVCVYFLFVLKARRKVYELQSVERILCLITLSSLLKVMSGKAIKYNFSVSDPQIRQHKENILYGF